jgi:hypothetical protein
MSNKSDLVFKRNLFIIALSKQLPKRKVMLADGIVTEFIKFCRRVDRRLG